MVYRIVHGLVDLNFDLFFKYAAHEGTRGHKYKLAINRSRLDIRKYFFANRAVPVWNWLNSEVIESPTFAIFKHRLARVEFGNFRGGGM